MAKKKPKKHKIGKAEFYLIVRIGKSIPNYPKDMVLPYASDCDPPKGWEYYDVKTEDLYMIPNKEEYLWLM